MGIQHVDALLWVDRRFQHQQFLLAAYPQEPPVHQVARLQLVFQLRPHLEHGEQESVGLDSIIEVMPVVGVVGSHFLLLEFGVEVVEVDSLYHSEFVDDRVVLLQIEHYPEDVLEAADVVGIFSEFDHFLGCEVAPEQFFQQENVVGIDFQRHVDFGGMPFAQRNAGRKQL